MAKDLTKLKKTDLLELAKKRKIEGISKLKKAELIKVLSKEKAVKSKASKRRVLKPEKPVKASSRKRALKSKVKLKPKKVKTLKKKTPNKKFSVKKIKKEEIVFSQDLVESTKFHAGIEVPRDRMLLEESPNISHHYDENVCVLLVRDPWCIFSYWEIGLSLWEDVRLRCQDSSYREILRVYDVTGLKSKDYNSYFDVELTPFIESWYINLKESGRSYVVEVGLRKDNGEFLSIIRSNTVTTPRYGPSDLVDEEWMVEEEDYWKMFALSGGYGTSISSKELQSVLRQKKLETISSSAKVVGAKR